MYLHICITHLLEAGNSKNINNYSFSSSSILYSKKPVSVQRKEIGELGKGSRFLQRKTVIKGEFLILNRRAYINAIGKVPLEIEQVKGREEIILHILMACNLDIFLSVFRCF